jgi:hypothetical protein
LSLALTGCGGEKEPVPVMVKGKVRYAGGKPVVNMVLIFHPLDDTRKRTTPSFVLDHDGRFQDVILPGRYKATLTPLPTMNREGPAEGMEAHPLNQRRTWLPLVMARYQDRLQSPWEIVIPETGTEDLVQTVK